MHEAVLTRAEGADAVLMAAAVADYTPAGGPAAGKIEKGEPLSLELERTADVLGDLGARRGGARRPVLVGFAAQTGDVVEPARRKLIEKSADLIVGNDVSRPDSGFDVDTNQVTLVTAEAADVLPLQSKTAVAAAVVDRVERLLIESAAASRS
jgi:phosphopantothenoylcysteine decarboxylase/phosphopantothenate--cysteine ligase